MQTQKTTQASSTTIAANFLAITLKRASGKLSLIVSLCLLATACTVSSANQTATDQTATNQSPPSNDLPNELTVTAATNPAEQNGETTAATETATKISDTAKPNEPSLQSVPPEGPESLTEAGFSYFQQMGPLEYAARLGGVPQQQAWRARLRLYSNSTDTPDGQTYLVKLDHYNLSPALYRDLLPSYGENTDPRLAEESPHQNFQFTFFPIMGMAADLLSEATLTSQSPMTENPACGIDLACAELRIAPEIAPASGTDISLEMAPWETAVEPTYGLVRELAAQAGWRQNGQWNYGEKPEGLSNSASADEPARPWVEILIDNYIGNGDGYSAEWIEHVADDSIRQVVHQIVYSDRAGMGQATTKYVCARGEAAGELLESCP